MPVADKDILYRVAYEEAVRALAEQQAEIDSFRGRAGLLFSTTAITTSFLGSHSLGEGHMGLAGWLALVAFAGVAFLSLAILWPHPWEFTLNPREAIEPYMRRQEPIAIDELHRELSFHMHNSFVENRVGVESFATLLQIASGMLTLEVILWIIAIASNA